MDDNLRLDEKQMRLDILLAEYNSLRAEMLHKELVVYGLTGLTITLVSAFFAIIFKIPPPDSYKLALIVPFVLLPLTFVFIGNCLWGLELVKQTAIIEDKIESLVPFAYNFWEKKFFHRQEQSHPKATERKRGEFIFSYPIPIRGFSLLIIGFIGSWFVIIISSFNSDFTPVRLNDKEITERGEGVQTSLG